MVTLFGLIDKIKVRPALYIGKKSIFCLQAYIMGFSIEKLENLKILQEFQHYIEKEYEIESSHSWASIIFFFSEDECEALELFFDEFDKFKLKHQLFEE